MLDGISFGNYLVVVTIALLCYYLLIILMFYRDELNAFLNHKSLLSSEVVEDEKWRDSSDQMAELSETVHQINSILNEAGTQPDKAELLDRLKELLSDFAGLNIPAWKVLVYQHIINESSLRCGITINEEELDGEDDRPRAYLERKG